MAIKNAVIPLDDKYLQKAANVTGAIDDALHEVQAARRDLTITGFCVRQAETLRRIGRARASLAYLLQSGDAGRS
ncbi:hypothetical protein [Bradyrhizobium iriomotense]|uniref:Uncharacterized protein n=1 Tax=Bradyrhizobium iriomotense TaxID=441950 RepID=A0ABQ6B1Y6_9BRAD|nr:hypothetical protein [Bradyrhizobium iriomotense]GLR88340.1 hypothetical protein GCM10007857_50520 [Bradyrhizobium iriomotense]